MDITSFIEKAEALRVLGVKITKDGQPAARHLYEPVCRRNIYSASKSFTAAAVGIAQREGLLSIDEKLTDAFAGELPRDVSEPLRAATVRDLLTMSLGQPQGFLMGEQRVSIVEDDWVKLSLAYPFTDMPGTKFVYNNVGPYLAGVLVQRRAGCDLVSYLTPRLFMPLGIRRPMWETDPMGYTFGAGGLFLTLDELHAFGCLLLNRGYSEGRSLIPEEWVAECGKKQVENGSDGYGYLFWRGGHNSFRADGKYSQLSIVYPEKNAVVTVVSECREGDKLLALIDTELAERL